MAKSDRLNIRLSPQETVRIETVCRLSGSDTRTEAVRKALMVYEYLLAAKHAGAKLISRDTQGQDTTIELL